MRYLFCAWGDSRVDKMVHGTIGKIMKVKELIEKLEKRNPEAEVTMYLDSDFVPVVGTVGSHDEKQVIICDKDTLDAFN